MNQHAQYCLTTAHTLRDYKRKCMLTLAEKFGKCSLLTISSRPRTTTRAQYTLLQIKIFTMWSTLTTTAKQSHRQNLRNMPNQCTFRLMLTSQTIMVMIIVATARLNATTLGVIMLRLTMQVLYVQLLPFVDKIRHTTHPLSFLLPLTIWMLTPQCFLVLTCHVLIFEIQSHE